MIVALIGIIVGLGIGFYLPITFPAQYSLYLSISIIAAFDSVFGAVENKFDTLIFTTGFFGNAFLAGMLAYIGDQLGVPLYYAAIVAFGVRLFENFAFIRRYFIAKLRE